MHVRVVELMVAGVRRPREECLADPGTIGTLSIGDIPIGTAEKRPLHAAQLWERWGTSARRGLLPPLFDVQVLRTHRAGCCCGGSRWTPRTDRTRRSTRRNGGPCRSKSRGRLSVLYFPFSETTPQCSTRLLLPL